MFYEEREGIDNEFEYNEFEWYKFDQGHRKHGLEINISCVLL